MKIKPRFFAVIAVTAALFTAPSAQAAVFIDNLDFGSGQTITETLFNFNASPSWTHNIHDNLSGSPLSSVTLLDATLTITFSGTAGNRTFGIIPNPESWSIDELGFLNAANNSTTVTQSFTFDALDLANLQLSGIFTAVPREWSLNALDIVDRDRFILRSSTLSGSYALKTIPSAPEPASFLLIGSGLALGAFLRRRRQPAAR